MSELIDREALDRAFTQLRFDSDGKLAHWGDRKDWCLHGSEVEKLISDAPTIPAPRWVRCEDRLPPDGVDVLGCMEYSIGHKSLWVVHRTNTKDKVWNDGTITHWMPLPELPKEDE